MKLSDGQDRIPATDLSPVPLRRLRTLPARLRSHEDEEADAEEEQKGGRRQLLRGGDSSDYTSLRDIIISQNPNPQSRWKLWRDAGSGSLNGRGSGGRRRTDLDQQSSRNLQLKDELLNTAARAYLLLPPQSPIRSDPAGHQACGDGDRSRRCSSSSFLEQIRGRMKALAAFLAGVQALRRRLSTWLFLKHKGLLHLLHKDSLPWF